MLPPGWYVLLYHDVSWEEPPELRGIGGMVVPPDRFEEHLRAIASEAELLSVAEARERAGRGDGGPCVSLWFDDGYRGVRRYAAPRMEPHRITGAISLCSEFTFRREMFWRAQLARLAAGDGLRFLRSRLRRAGVDPGESVRETTIERFDPAVREAIDRVWKRRLPDEARADAFRIYDEVEGLRVLRDAGWRLANHSASHWPIGEPRAIAHLRDQFELCERTFAAAGIELSDDWVLPFDRTRAPDLDQKFDREAPDRTLVLVGNRVTRAEDLARRRVHRIVAPPCSGAQLVRRMRRAAGNRDV